MMNLEALAGERCGCGKRLSCSTLHDLLLEDYLRVRREALEEAARVAETYAGPGMEAGKWRSLGSAEQTKADIAEAIRALLSEGEVTT